MLCAAFSQQSLQNWLYYLVSTKTDNISELCMLRFRPELLSQKLEFECLDMILTVTKHVSQESFVAKKVSPKLSLSVLTREIGIEVVFQWLWILSYLVRFVFPSLFYQIYPSEIYLSRPHSTIYTLAIPSAILSIPLLTPIPSPTNMIPVICLPTTYLALREHVPVETPKDYGSEPSKPAEPALEPGYETTHSDDKQVLKLAVGQTVESGMWSMLWL